MKYIHEIENLKGKTVFVRADFNVPVSAGVITDDFRVQKTLKTLDFLKNAGVKIVMASHFEGEGGSLAPVAQNLATRGYGVTFIEDFFPETPKEIADMKDGEIVLLQNLRKYPEEKANNSEFAKHLASFASVYVNEAFSSSHRAHASIVGIPEFLPSYAGFCFAQEVMELSRTLHPKHPFVFILGGAKFETKIPLIKKFFAVADKVFIGGALANDFLKASGMQTGTSLLSSDISQISEFLTDKLIMPIDVIVKNGESVTTKKVTEVLESDYIVDVGPETMDLVCPVVEKAATVLWNGPLGNYELGYKDATRTLAQSIGESKAESFVGGGDTIASIAELNLTDKITFISTGGGAMLDFLANETLPGIQALEKSQ